MRASLFQDSFNHEEKEETLCNYTSSMRYIKNEQHTELCMNKGNCILYENCTTHTEILIYIIYLQKL